MGWFARKARQRFVSVSFRDLTTSTPPNADHAYVYEWTLSTPPTVGTRIVVPGGDGRAAFAVVAAVDVAPPRGMALKPVTRLVSAAEIDKAAASAAADEAAWLNMARQAAGLSTTGRVRSRVPDGFPPIAPVDGTATAEQAATYGSMWWRVFKAAQSLGWVRGEMKRVESIARRWYAVRDKGGN
ncbi:hypothetical protein F6W69_06810 [Microbacterium oxydans]|uniref:hypothetical protein n=1 Tax=Microbacterium oxydans TaxID=82380 RepID=UPI0011437565|nr:hypothetical protein [Microbacterium oxydans]KAB1893719.1 hypothetical protein F6W69_06810 [Microbacterium oxydans]GED38234.1 hypothetical protein MOX01_13760 [Microbacterium oxydans]